MTRIPVKNIDNDDYNAKGFPAKNTCYKWHSVKKYPALLIKISGRLFFDVDEWENMAARSREQQVKEARLIKAGMCCNA